MEIEKVQNLLSKYQLDYWVLTDYHGRDKLSVQLANLPEGLFSSRRWIYLIPQSGQAIKIVSHIEKHILDTLEGENVCYSSYESLKVILKAYLSKCKVAMQYSPESMLPIIGTTDAGFIELAGSVGAQIVSSGDLIQELYCILTEEQVQSHIRAGQKILKIRDEVYGAIRHGINTGKYLREIDVLHLIKEAYEREGLTCDHDDPYIAINDHATQLTFSPTEENSYSIQESDRILLDLWAREKDGNGIYYDVTFCAYAGKNIPEDYARQFDKVVGAREHCLGFIQKKLDQGEIIQGYEVDKACRAYFNQYGEAEYFIHRTGHNIGKEVHGPGANLDSFESIDYRKILPGTLFSIEPGLYKDDLGVRTEIDVYLDKNGKVNIFGEKQNKIFTI